MLEQLSDGEITIIHTCIKIVLESDEFFPGEIATRVGVNERILRQISAGFLHIVNLKDMRLLEIQLGITHNDFVLAIHNCLVEVAYGIHIDDAKMLARYGTVRQNVEKVFEKWKTLVERPGFYE